MLVTIFVAMKLKVAPETEIMEYVRDSFIVDSIDSTSETIIQDKITSLIFILNEVMASKLKTAYLQYPRN